MSSLRANAKQSSSWIAASAAPPRNDERGFTLVELSIVLVIIGLLIGGILVGQSLIQSAEINKEVSRLSQYAIAVVQFKAKFRQEAGDTNLFPNPGNNDMDNEDALTGGSCTTPGGEDYSAWSHLTQSGMLTGERYVWPNPGAACTGWVNNNGAGYIGITPTNKVTANVASRGLYRYLYSKSGWVIGGNRYQRSLPISYYNPEILWGLENKLDDGVPSISTGRIRSYNSAFMSLCNPATIAAASAGYKYCNPFIFFNDSL